MILTMTKYHENLLRVSPLSLLSMVKFFLSLETKMVLEIPNVKHLYLLSVRYIAFLFPCHIWSCTDEQMFQPNETLLRIIQCKKEGSFRKAMRGKSGNTYVDDGKTESQPWPSTLVSVSKSCKSGIFQTLMKRSN